jgi:hypothetical protein
MSLPRLLRSRCARALTSPAIKPESLRLPPSHRCFSTSRRRLEALAAEDDLYSKLPGIDPSKLETTQTITPKALVPNQDLVFGRTFTGQSAALPSICDIADKTSCQIICSPSNGQPPTAGCPLE